MVQGCWRSPALLRTVVVAVFVSCQGPRRRSQGALLGLSPLVSPPSSRDTSSKAERAGSRSKNRLLAAVWHHALNNYPGLFCRVIPGVDMPVAGVSRVLNSLGAHDESKFPPLSLCQGAPTGTALPRGAGCCQADHWPCCASPLAGWVIQTSAISGAEMLTGLFMMISSS